MEEKPSIKTDGKPRFISGFLPDGLIFGKIILLMENISRSYRMGKNLFKYGVMTFIVGMVSALYYPVILGMAAIWWDDPDYSHGLLVPLISLYFVWSKKEDFARIHAAPDYRGVPFLMMGIGLLTLGNAGSELFLMRSSLLSTIAGLVIMFLGMRHFKLLLFPIGFLAFMIPLPAIIFNAVAFPLQVFAAQTAAFCLQTVQIPVLREGNLIYLATSIMDVTEACSGIRSLMSLMALGTLFAYITQRSHLKRGIMMASTIPIAILSNAFRVTGTGLLAQFVGEEAAQGFYHTFTGWLVFISAFFLLLLVGFVLSKVKDRKQACDRPVFQSIFQERGQSTWVPLIVAAVVLGGGLYVNRFMLIHGTPVFLEKELSTLPLQIEQWSGKDHPFEEKTVRVLGVTDYINRQYVVQGKGSGNSNSLWLYAGYYASQRAGATYHSPKNCLPGSGWEIVELENLAVPMISDSGQEKTYIINKVIVQKGLERQLILYWYQDRGRIIKSEYWAKIYLILDSITKGRTDGSMVRVSVPIPRGEATSGALNLGLEYIRQVSPYLAEYLPGEQAI